MKKLYIDASMGAAGDMLSAALYECFDNKEEILHELNNLGIPGVEFKAQPAEKCGITGTHFEVEVNGEVEGEHEHHHHHDHDHEHEHHHELDHHHEHDHHHHHHHEEECCCECEHEHDHEHHHDHDHHEHDHHHHHHHEEECYCECEHEHDHEHHHDHDHHEHDHHHHHHHEEECCCGHDHDHEHHHHHDHDHDHEHHHDHEHGHHHEHHGMHDIEHLVRGHMNISEKLQDEILDVYMSIAEAESQVHGVAVDQIHFHELGTMDALADVTAVCYMMDKLGVGEVVCSPVHVGSGTVKCAHGVLPVPAPATANILKGIPCYSEHIRGELCTPTGAALLKHFVNRFGDMPMMSFDKIGYGMGKKDFERANCVRVILGEGEDRSETIYELSLNVDDMSAEKIGFACERMFEAGALDVYTEAIGMKKGRPGTLIRVMYRDDKRDAILKAVFRHTTTIGCREVEVKRYVLDRRIETVETSFGPVRRKAVSGYGVERFKYEYEDLARIAEENDISIDEVIEKL